MIFRHLTLLAVAGGAILMAQNTAPDKAKIERGKYLVEEVGKCQECHSPKGDDGKFDMERWMKGAVLEVAPIKPIQGWHKTAPDITGTGRIFERWKDEGVLKFLMTGLTPKGTPSDAPMPAYKLKQEDAEAMLAYLKSLK